MIDGLFEKAAVGAIVVTSDPTSFYNCVAWALHSDVQYIWPDADEQFGWPIDIPREETLGAFERFFEKIGFVACHDTAYEQGFEKIAIYQRSASASHVSRQISIGEFVGQWTSKLGPQVDVRHKTAESIEGKAYGQIGRVMRRPYNGYPPKLPELFPPPPRLVTSDGLPLLK